MTKKEKCKKLMEKLFGPLSAKLVDDMNEDECVDFCKQKARAYLGEKVAEEFSRI